jgi:hypothetical protein
MLVMFIRPAPDRDHPCHTPSSRMPTGSKGMSEGGVIGALGAVTLAVSDAFAPFRVVVERQPLTAGNISALLEATPATMQALRPMVGSRPPRAADIREKGRRDSQTERLECSKRRRWCSIQLRQISQVDRTGLAGESQIASAALLL